MQDELRPRHGMDVVGLDGEKVGTVQDATEVDYIVVSKGFFFPTDYFVPLDAIASTDDSTVYLKVTKDDALNQGWDTLPGMDDDPQFVDPPETVRVPLSEEELDVHTREVKRGDVQIEKDVIEEDQTFDVPVSEERVNVERRVVNREVAPGETVFEEETIEVPVYGEEVEVQKSVRVREEIEITKDRVEDVARVTETVRHEEASVVDDGDMIVNDDATQRKS